MRCCTPWWGAGRQLPATSAYAAGRTPGGPAAAMAGRGRGAHLPWLLPLLNRTGKLRCRPRLLHSPLQLDAGWQALEGPAAGMAGAGALRCLGSHLLSRLPLVLTVKRRWQPVLLPSPPMHDTTDLLIYRWHSGIRTAHDRTRFVCDAIFSAGLLVIWSIICMRRLCPFSRFTSTGPCFDGYSVGLTDQALHHSPSAHIHSSAASPRLYRRVTMHAAGALIGHYCPHPLLPAPKNP
mmetsp:Transcript_10786/g.32380  ORF Transcript_10786/g.32380 Transcript_10786/m.32380 type:complete len:236 (+) Transcript_10786:273-980(+)